MASTRVRVRAKYSSNGMAGYTSYGPYLKWPSICPCCGKRIEKGIDRELTGSQQHGRTIYSISWKIPYCETCDRHLRSYSRLLLFSICAFLLWIGLGGFLLSSSNIEVDISVPIFLLGFFLIPILSLYIYFFHIRKLAVDKCTSMREAIAYKSYDGEWHTILFKNKEYAEIFSKANDGFIDSTPSHKAPFF